MHDGYLVILPQYGNSLAFFLIIHNVGNYNGLPKCDKIPCMSVNFILCFFIVIVAKNINSNEIYCTVSCSIIINGNIEIQEI